MNDIHRTIDEEFLKKLLKRMETVPELNVKKIYSIFPEMNPKTILWRLHKLVQQGKLYKAGRGYYSAKALEEHHSAGYDYLQKKSKDIFDIVSEYGYMFYITGLDALIGELLHVPEQYTVLVVIEEAGMDEIQNDLNNNGYFVIQENEQSLTHKNSLRNKIDVIMMKGKKFDLSYEGIALKEKGFVDLYFAVTRLDYSVSIQELSRIYENMKRNDTVTAYKMQKSAKDRGLDVEINWLLVLENINPKVIEFMNYQLKEAKWKI